MRKISFRFLVLFAAATSVFVWAAPSVADDGATNDSKATALKNEILRGYENYFKNIDNVEITTDFEYALDGELSTQRSRFIKSGPNILWEQDGRDENETIIYGINKDYFFTLVDENGKRVVAAVEKIDSPLAEKDFVAPRPWGSLREGQAKEYAVSTFARNAGFGYALSHCWAFGLLDSPSFSVDSYEETTTDDGEKVVEVTFSNEPTAYFNERAGRLDPANIRGGRLEFLPDQYWQIRSGSVVFWDGETDYTMEWTNEFSGSPDATPYELTIAGRRLDMDYRYAYDVKCARLAAPPDDSRFTLSHYGLPEPDFGDSRLNWVRIFLLALGGAAILFSLRSICRKVNVKKEIAQ